MENSKRTTISGSGSRPIVLSDTEVHTWFERDRACVDLRLKFTDETLMEWWDADVHQAVEDGYLNPNNWHQSAFDQWVSHGRMTFYGSRA